MSDEYMRGLKDGWAVAQRVCLTDKKELNAKGLLSDVYLSNFDEYEYSALVIIKTDIQTVIGKLGGVING